MERKSSSSVHLARLQKYKCTLHTLTFMVATAAINVLQMTTTNVTFLTGFYGMIKCYVALLMFLMHLLAGNAIHIKKSMTPFTSNLQIILPIYLKHPTCFLKHILGLAIPIPNLSLQHLMFPKTHSMQCVPTLSRLWRPSLPNAAPVYINQTTITITATKI